jgi:hypothetical protein
MVIKKMLQVIMHLRRRWRDHRTASCARSGPVDHADLKRLIEGSRYGDDPGLVGRPR